MSSVIWPQLSWSCVSDESGAEQTQHHQKVSADVCGSNAFASNWLQTVASLMSVDRMDEILIAERLISRGSAALRKKWNSLFFSINGVWERMFLNVFRAQCGGVMNSEVAILRVGVTPELPYSSAAVRGGLKTIQSLTHHPLSSYKVHTGKYREYL